MPDFDEFALKEFFYTPAAKGAEVNLSKSFAEPMGVSELLALEPQAADQLLALPLKYPGLDGSAALRAAISSLYAGIDPDQIIVTTGLDDGLGLAALALVEPGDRVIVQTPCYQTYMTVPAWRGAEVVQWRAHRQNGWVPDLSELDRLLEQPAKWVIVNFPHNPTGFTPDDSYIADLTAILERRGTTLLCDEIYAGLALDQAEQSPLATLYDKAVSMNSVSKTLGCPGLRIGWLASRDEAVLARLRAARMHFNSFAGSPCEFLAEIALRHAPEILNRNIEILTQNAEIASQFFANYAELFEWEAPRGGVNGFPAWRGPGGTHALSDRLLSEAATLVAPSAVFDAGDSNLRLGLGCRDLSAGLDRFDDHLRRNL